MQNNDQIIEEYAQAAFEHFRGDRSYYREVAKEYLFFSSLDRRLRGQSQLLARLRDNHLAKAAALQEAIDQCKS